MKPTFKAPGSKQLNLEHEKPLSIFAFKFNLRRYDRVRRLLRARALRDVRHGAGALAHTEGGVRAGAYTRPLFSSI